MLKMLRGGGGFGGGEVGRGAYTYLDCCYPLFQWKKSKPKQKKVTQKDLNFIIPPNPKRKCPN